MGNGISDVLQSLTSSSSSSSTVQPGALPRFLGQWRSITFKRCVLNMVEGHHLYLRSCSLLFHNFKWFNIKAGMAHHTIIPKEVNGLLAKGAIEPLTGDAGFYSNLCVVPKHTLALQLALNLYWFNYYMHKLLLICLLSNRYGNLFNMVIMLFLLISRILIYIFLFVSITITFYILFGNINLISGSFCPLGWLQP